MKGRIVTGEAMFCQKSIVAKIIENGRDYVLPVKDNQKNLRENIQTAFNSSPVCERVGPNISTPDADMRAFSPERPTKVSSPCTVDAGHFQYETDFFNYTHTNFAGAGTQSYETFDPTIKPGITNWMDFEVVTGCYQNTTT